MEAKVLVLKSVETYEKCVPAGTPVAGLERGGLFDEVPPSSMHPKI
jgi:hypothetical protein